MVVIFLFLVFLLVAAIVFIRNRPLPVPAGSAVGQRLEWDGSAWVAVAAVPIPTGSAVGQRLEWDGSAWVAVAAVSTADVLPAGSAVGQRLEWDGSAWGAVADVPVTAGAAAGQRLEWDGSAWVAVAAVSAADVLPAGATAGQRLEWDGSAWGAAANVPVPAGATAGQRLEWDGSAWQLVSVVTSHDILAHSDVLNQVFKPGDALTRVDTLLQAHPPLPISGGSWFLEYLGPAGSWDYSFASGMAGIPTQSSVAAGNTGVSLALRNVDDTGANRSSFVQNTLTNGAIISIFQVRTRTTVYAKVTSSTPGNLNDLFYYPVTILQGSATYLVGDRIFVNLHSHPLVV